MDAETFQNWLNGDDQTFSGAGTACVCLPFTVNKTQQGLNEPRQTTAMRISNKVQEQAGGRTTFGDRNRPVQVNWTGGWEGQPGGTQFPIRNQMR